MTAADRYFEYLGSMTMTVAAQTSPSVSFQSRDFLVFEIFCPGQTLTGNAGIQFNGDTGSNYAYRSYGPAAGATTNAVDAGHPDVQIDISPNSTGTTGFVSTVWCSNFLAKDKLVVFCAHLSIQGTASVQLSVGGGNWYNTTSVITSAALKTFGTTFNAGTQIKVFGCNFS